MYSLKYELTIDGCGGSGDDANQEKGKQVQTLKYIFLIYLNDTWMI